MRFLAALLRKLGHSILPSGITKIENQTRRVSVADLVALALALGVNPNRLLLPVDGSPVALTPEFEVDQRRAWGWADGRAGLLQPWRMGPDDREDEPPQAELLDDFLRHARPVEDRIRDQHTAMQAARAVTQKIWHLLAVENVGGAVDGVVDPDIRKTLRLHLNRLIAEVEALLGASDGEH